MDVVKSEGGDLNHLRIQRAAPALRLSDRERQIVLAMCAGMTNKEIAEHLGCSEGYVANRLAALYRLTGCRNRAGLATWFHGRDLPSQEEAA